MDTSFALELKLFYNLYLVNFLLTYITFKNIKLQLEQL